MTPVTRFDPDALASLESERDFLLRSIKDLDTERETGNLDDERYRELKGDYTARAAAVLRSIENGRDAAVIARPPVPRKRKLLTAAGILAFVVVAALALSAATGTRRDGQTATGNAQSGGAQSGGAQSGGAGRAALEKQIQEHPDDPAARLALGRFLLESQDWTEAVKQYLTAAKLDPRNPEANAYAGWMLYQVAANAKPTTKGELTSEALGRLDAAVAASDTYADAFFFRGMVRFRGVGDAKGAIPDFERFLTLVPEGPLNESVKATLGQARQQAG